jgi:uncharacterized protein
MDSSIFLKTVNLFNNLKYVSSGSKSELLFHGGESLLAGVEFFENKLPSLRKVCGDSMKIGIQSNLWSINDQLCGLFKEHNIGVGTSLDGPENINDFQRSTGYFKKTMLGIEKVQEYGIPLSCIATFTSYSASRYKEVFDFFLNNNLLFSIHAAVKPFEFKGDDKLFLNPDEFGNLLVNLLDLYLKHADKIMIGTLDTLIKNVSNDKSGLCTFTKCLGNYLAVDPTGDLYTCNRFVGNKSFSVGNVNDVHSWEDIKKSPAWKRLENWQQTIDNDCTDCSHKNICHGGCMYTAFASGNEKPIKDPYCEAYKKIYTHILDRGMDEFFSDKNMESVSIGEKDVSKSSFMKKGALLRIMNNDPHPYDIARLSKKIVASALLGITNSPEKVSEILLSLNVATSKERAKKVIDNLYKELTLNKGGYGNIYIHITENCNQRCSHCYVYSDGEVNANYLPIDVILKAIKDAVKVGFNKIILIGGEPLLHPKFGELLDILINLKQKQKVPKIILRTNLSLDIDDVLLSKLVLAFNQITVSIDGSENLHDTRRGKGTYRKVIDNLKRIDKKSLKNKFSLCTVIDHSTLSDNEIKSEKQHIANLKDELNLLDIRFLPQLPLGRVENEIAKRPRVKNITVAEWVNNTYSPRSSCGLGYNLMIDSDGSAYPCHVYRNDRYNLNNLFENELENIIKKDNFLDLRKINVNTNEKCLNCNFRYLCGGLCGIWKDEDCSDLYLRAQNLFLEALEILQISFEAILHHGLKIKLIKNKTKV